MLEKPDLNKPVFKMYPDKAQLVKDGRCTICSNTINEDDFRDITSCREFTISGMCQSCQDAIFGVR